MGRVSRDDPGTLESTPTTQMLSRAELPLLSRPAARRFQIACESVSGAPISALDYVLRQDGMSLQDCVDIFLVDQAQRWSRGIGLPVEVYCRVLRSLSASEPVNYVWELIAHEYALRQAWCDADNQPSLDEFCRRFPELSERLKARFDDQPADADDSSTHVVATRDDPTVSVEQTCSRPPDGDQDITTIELDDESEFPVSESGYEQIATSLLGASRPFSVLPPSLVARIEACLRPVSFKPGEYLIREGEHGDGLYVIASGEVEIRSAGPSGQVVNLGRCMRGEIVGEMALLTDAARTANVVAVTQTEASFLPAQGFDDLATNYPVVSRVLTQLLADRLGRQGRDALAGKTLNQFQIMHRLGRGGMAIVYHARDMQSQQDVALKMMSHRLVYDAHALKLFQREARLIESFDHRNIVRMLGRFQAFRTFFIVMEFCHGVSLEEIIRHRGPLPEAEFRRVIGQTVSALQYAHSRQVVHRDVKPSNIMLAENGTVKLMDFGLANPIEDMPSGKQAVAGTPQYMAPEQLRGEVIDERADYFALGCTAYKLLTGESLIAHKSLDRIRQIHEVWQPRRPPNISREVADFLEVCLQKNPSDRKLDLLTVAAWATAAPQ